MERDAVTYGLLPRMERDAVTYGLLPPYGGGYLSSEALYNEQLLAARYPSLLDRERLLLSRRLDELPEASRTRVLSPSRALAYQQGVRRVRSPYRDSIATWAEPLVVRAAPSYVQPAPVVQQVAQATAM